MLTVWPIIQEAIFMGFIMGRKKATWPTPNSQGERLKDEELLQIIEDLLGENLGTKHPIVYSPGYNITAFGLEKLHPFDSRKYGRIYNFLTE
ncbi:unnamed protein product [Moneuplotes crassus]|uniref:Uncharacterized protein n=1 Tax=Euplotes crassus TaxID=5936 RepID=A0AAD1UPU3_EUPCR|nr:unnamed protein product [Moneuplotes crassus]